MTKCVQCNTEYADGTRLSAIMCSAGGYCSTGVADTEPPPPARPHVHAGFHDPLDDDDDRGLSPVSRDDGFAIPAPYARRKPWVSPLRKERQAVLPFAMPSDCAQVIQAFPQRPFTPKGLMLWGDLEALDVEAAIIGRDEQLMVAFGAVPARWFGTAKSFEQVAKEISEGMSPAAWGTWDTCVPGVVIRLHFNRAVPADFRALMWGISLS